MMATVADSWKMISIREPRLNGIRLRTAMENRRTPGNTLDDVLEKAGIPNLTDAQLKKELIKAGKMDYVEKFFGKEGTAR